MIVLKNESERYKGTAGWLVSRHYRTTEPPQRIYRINLYSVVKPYIIKSLTTATATRTSKRLEQLVKISKTTTLHVHHAFLYISLPSLHDYDMNCLLSREHTTTNLLLFLNLDIFLKNSTPREIIALKFHRSRSHFLSEVFAAVAVVVS